MLVPAIKTQSIANHKKIYRSRTGFELTDRNPVVAERSFNVDPMLFAPRMEELGTGMLAFIAADIADDVGGAPDEENPLFDAVDELRGRDANCDAAVPGAAESPVH